MDISVCGGWIVDQDWEGGGRPRLADGAGAVALPVPLGRDSGQQRRRRGAVLRSPSTARTTAPNSRRRRDAPGPKRIADVWNNESLQLARRFLQQPRGHPRGTRARLLRLPMTVMFEDYQKHLRAGHTWLDYKVPIKTYSAYNYFWHRRPPRVAEAAARRAR
jgi:hypothetical protein